MGINVAYGLSRRQLLKVLGTSLSLPALGGVLRGQGPASRPAAPHIGIQMAGFNVYDEGPEHVVKFLRETCRANALHVYAMHAHRYAGFDFENPYDIVQGNFEHWADHGVPKPTRTHADIISSVYYRSDPKHYAMPGQAPREDDLIYGGRDVYDDLAEPAGRAGMKLYARMCDWGNVYPFVDGMDEWTIKLASGKRIPFVCVNNPEYRAWMRAFMTDLFAPRPHLAGLNYGFEHSTPLIGAIAWGKDDPDCFCEHCLAKAETLGGEPDRARRGFEALKAWNETVREGKPADGHFVTLWRTLREHPDLFVWDRLKTTGLHELCQEIHDAVKAVDPAREVGFHIPHSMSFSPFYRAAYDYADMRSYADYLKPVVYHDSAGWRFRQWELRGTGTSVFGDFTPEERVRAYYRIMGYDPAQMPTWDNMSAQNEQGAWGFGADYVAREVKRCKAGFGKRVYAGVGFDVPNEEKFRYPYDYEAEGVAIVTRAAFDAGAEGVVISREYHENTRENLEAVGRVVDELT